MFEAPGTIYVYRSYGIHWCMNVVVGQVGEASAVLLRGGEVIEGMAEAIRRRGRTTDLTDGPGKLCQALAVTGEDSGSVLGRGITLDVATPLTQTEYSVSPRIGISKATDRLWRFTAS